MKLSDSAQGVIYATAAYVWWGFLPLFWAIFDPVGNGWEVIAHRIFWTGVLLTVWIAIAVGWARFDDSSEQSDNHIDKPFCFCARPSFQH